MKIVLAIGLLLSVLVYGILLLNLMNDKQLFKSSRIEGLAHLFTVAIIIILAIAVRYL